MSISLNPIGPWPLVAIASVAVMILTIWAYRERLRGTTGGLAMDRAGAPPGGGPALSGRRAPADA